MDVMKSSGGINCVRWRFEDHLGHHHQGSGVISQLMMTEIVLESPFHTNTWRGW